MYENAAEAARKSLKKHGAASNHGDLTLDIYLIKKVLELIIIVDLESESIFL